MAILKSFLFVPADDDRLFASALAKPCDCVILDLEDGTHASRKQGAREKIASRLAEVRQAGKTGAVRINGNLNAAVSDLRAAVCSDLRLVVVPKVEQARDVVLLAGLVEELCSAPAIVPGRIEFLLQIESPAALPRLPEIAGAHPAVMGMMLGSEDYALECGALPTEDVLELPSLLVLQAARAAGIQPIGFIGSIASIGDIPTFRRQLERARGLGFRGAIVVHPKFLASINECFTSTAEDLAQARAVVAAFDDASARGVGAIKLGDLMIDKPIYLRAVNLLKESRA